MAAATYYPVSEGTTSYAYTSCVILYNSSAHAISELLPDGWKMVDDVSCICAAAGFIDETDSTHAIIGNSNSSSYNNWGFVNGWDLHAVFALPDKADCVLQGTLGAKQHLYFNAAHSDDGAPVVFKIIPPTGYAVAGWLKLVAGYSGSNALSGTYTYSFTSSDVIVALAYRSATQNSPGTAYIPLLKPLECNVLFDPQGGSLGVASLVKTVTYGNAYGALPSPTRNGYVFSGWFTAVSGGEEITSASIFDGTADTTLYARWTADATTTLPCAFVANGGAYTSFPGVSRTNYELVGWYDDPLGGSAVSIADLSEVDDFTVYAHWRGVELTITFDANGGSVSEASRTVRYGDLYGTLPVPTYSGHAFAGWFTAASGGTRVYGGSVATASIPLYAHWKESTSVTVLG